MSNFMNRMMDSGWGGGTGLLVWLVLLLLVVLLGIVAFRLLGGSASSPSHADPRSRPDDDALQSLERRYAAGEIDEKQFTQRRETILTSRRGA